MLRQGKIKQFGDYMYRSELRCTSPIQPKRYLFSPGDADRILLKTAVRKFSLNGTKDDIFVV